MFVVAIVTVEPETSSTGGSSYSRRQSSVVVLPMSRRFTDSVITGIGVDTTVHMAAAFTAAIAATNSQSVGPQLSSLAARTTGSSVSSTTVGQDSTLRRDGHQQNGVSVSGSCSVMGHSDAVLPASRHVNKTTFICL